MWHTAVQYSVVCVHNICNVSLHRLKGMCVQVNAFKRTDEDFYEAVHRKDEPEGDAGTTALAALVAGDALLVANAGDCRAVMCRRGRAIDLSRDHNAESEASRVEAAGTLTDLHAYVCMHRRRSTLDLVHKLLQHLGHLA